MKFITFCFSFIAICFFYSCQKGIDGDITPTTPGTPVVKIKTYTEDVSISGAHTVVTFNLNYDANDRLISMISATNPGDKFVFQYNSAASYTMDLFNANALSIHEIFFLNSFSFVDSTFQYNDTQDTMTEKYIYNSAKQLIQLRQYDYSSASGASLFDTYNYVYDANGNVIKESDAYTITTYEYYANLTSNTYIGLPYLPAGRSLVKTTTIISGGTTEVLNHAYTFDSNNRLSTEKITITGSTDSVLKTYTYY